MNASHHRVWPYTGVAWAALVVVPTATAAVQWQMGIGRDPDMTGVGELITFLLFLLPLPMATLAFGVFAPLAIAMDFIVKGRTPRFVNVLLGATLAAPALFVEVFGTGWPEHSFAEVITAFRYSAGRAPAMLAATLLAGMIVGLGLRHRRRLLRLRPSIDARAEPSEASRTPTADEDRSLTPY